MKNLVIIVFACAAILASGCSSLHKSDLANLQGAWAGKEIGGKMSDCHILVAGNNAEFRSSDTNEWLKATFSLREDTNPRQIIFVTAESPYPPHIGITRYAIYRIEDDMVRLTANEPGVPNVPSAFDAPGARQFELKILRCR